MARQDSREADVMATVTGSSTVSQLSFLSDAAPSVRRERKRGHVRATSVETYQAQTATLERRADEVTAWLRVWLENHDRYPTSAELAYDAPECQAAIGTAGPDFRNWDACLLYVRRGMSDACAVGVIEVVPNGKRLCEVSKRKCETWRVKQR